jgi:glutamine cyclotransferase
VLLLAALTVAACGGDDGTLGEPSTSVDVTTTTTTDDTTTTPPAPTTTLGADTTTTITSGPDVDALRVVVIERRPHDPDAFTQGFEIDGESLYESTGLYGQSSVRRVDKETGEVLDRWDLPDDQFGEGLTVLGDELVVLTWREGVAHIVDTPSLDPLGTFTYDTEGWGICASSVDIFMSDGSDTIYVRDPDTFEEERRISVTLDGEPVDELNELECAGGWLYANVWHTDLIYRIEPESGRVSAVIDAGGLLSDDERSDPEAVLNGIAYDASSGTFLLTGKRWPAMFEVQFVHA